MSDLLAPLLEDGVIDEVLGRLKSGKEADVWLVRHAGNVLCAKVYKDRATRSFKNNSSYKEGRAVRNSRTRRAIERGSKFGREAEEEAWKSAEADALYRLHAEGVRVPTPTLFYEGVLLMELVSSADGQPAPRLIDVAPTPEQAAALYQDLRGQVVRMLVCDLIHGDLSPYNVLLGAAGPTIIDFPQVIGAAANSQAELFFKRDVDTLRIHLGGFAPALLQRASDADEIWRAYVRRELGADFEPTGRAQVAAPKHAPRVPGHQHRPPHDQRPHHGARPHQGARPQQASHQPAHAPSHKPSHPPSHRPAHQRPHQGGTHRPPPQQQPAQHVQSGQQPSPGAPRQHSHGRPQHQPRPPPHPRQAAPQRPPAAPAPRPPPPRAPQPKPGPVVERVVRPPLAAPAHRQHPHGPPRHHHQRPQRPRPGRPPPK